MTPLELDGSDGGGQLVRTALTLSCLGGQPFEMTGVRADRPNPGLRPQHLACVDAAAALTGATVEGADAGSERLTFAPAHAPRGDVAVDVGTAGSVALVFDTVLPFAAEIDEPITLTASGGTDVKWAPTFDFFRGVKLPLLARVGLAAAVRLERRGFYPTGGGRATLHVAPSSLRPLSCDTRGDLVASAHAVAARNLADAEVCERALDRVRERLSVPLVETHATYAETDCPGFALLLSVAGETRAGFDALGEKGVPAEHVADEAVDAFESWRQGPGAVDGYLADQLVLPLALAGGVVTAPHWTSHLRTNLSLVDAFGHDLRTRADGAGVTVERE
ncbi:RNA 3'-terminal phosphate cyclase [Salinigranum rubrum]|uniref:RNA 3'-terminal phosphate cyclase n=1 Tax=Salinigranum rubrum TaxID=755307 RepID=A0A2I8VF60_9EURY|nr:RNA 3'-terminal phosphate cyclase [Salinigranum rubrum]AUV80568.1 RNA 3'-terminal phosphate cyclase [Salinigranum rubrum]